MKKLILTAAAVFSLAFANAQDGEGFAKGDIFVSGSFGYDSESTGDNKNNSFSITPRVGFFVTENITVGARLGYTTQKIEVGGGETKINTLNAGAFGRYYFTPSNKFSIFGELGFDYVSAKTEIASTDSTTDGFGINVGPGVSYFLSDNFALEAFWGALGYATAKADGATDSTDLFSIGLDLDDINLGLVYKF
ncbi:porin family protein [Aquimarina sp. BL5]|uniref:porin family protein n=1 Tax=Aquimarina sp. BL5 TaxID=1714860 RepID=UPI000E4EC131|nr:porin family protein [Aquimarina sp. BL5]AXT49538.1 porin family protein [Aquimarina sp. BL5]RKM93425.1 porin family protein [Aquimarina sp. BL5]